jgi:hypothetical protein
MKSMRDGCQLPPQMEQTKLVEESDPDLLMGLP